MTGLRICIASWAEEAWPGAAESKPTYRVIYVNWLKAVSLYMGVEQAKLLAAIAAVVGVIDVQNNIAGYRAEAVTEQINHGQPH